MEQLFLAFSDLFLVFVIFASGIAAGFLKGVTGIALPLTFISLVSLYLPLIEAIPIVTLPLLLCNFIQANYKNISYKRLSRYRWILAGLLFLSPIGAYSIKFLNDAALGIFIGILLLSIVLMRFFLPHLYISANGEKYASPLIGLFAGLISGASALHGNVIASYLTMLKLKKENFVEDMGLLLLFGGVAIFYSMLLAGHFTMTIFILSLYACLPIIIAMHVGTKLRGKINERAFAIMIQLYIAAMGARLIIENIL